MAPDFWSMGCTMGRVEVALVLSMARAANGCAQATLRYARSMGHQALAPLDGAYQLDRPGLEPSADEAYRAYLRELAGAVRISGIGFFEALEQLRLAGGVSRPKAAELSPAAGTPESFRAVDAGPEIAPPGERAGRARQSGTKGAASKDFLLY